MQTANQNAVFGTGPEYTFTTMIEPIPVPEDDHKQQELYERNIANTDKLFDEVIPRRARTWKRTATQTRKLIQRWNEWEEPRAEARKRKLEENQPVQLGKRQRSASVTDTESERDYVFEGIIPAVQKPILIHAAVDPILIPAVQEPILVHAAVEPTLIPAAEDSDSEIEFVKATSSVRTPASIQSDLYKMVRFVGISELNHFAPDGMASASILDTTCSLLARQHMYNGNKAVVSSLVAMSLLNLDSDIVRVNRMRECIRGCETVFIPCLYGKDYKHWTLVILFTTAGFMTSTNHVLYVDSWRPDPREKQQTNDLARLVAKVASKAMWGKEVKPRIASFPAIQENSVDCGYFVLENLIYGYLSLDRLIQELEGKKPPMSQNWVSRRKRALGGFYKKVSAFETIESVDDAFMQLLTRNYVHPVNRTNFNEGLTTSSAEE